MNPRVLIGAIDWMLTTVFSFSGATLRSFSELKYH